MIRAPRFLAALSLAALASSAFAEGPRPKAILHTTAGDITVELYADKAPNTVANFIGLSKGTKAWTDPNTGTDQKGKPLYNGTIFHRVIPGFMIQGGDPTGSGAGDIGFQFANESSDLTFDKPGVVAMANRGPDTNSSQFFITVGPRHQLDAGYTIFGQTLSGMDVVEKIINAPRNANDRPDEPTKITSIEVNEGGAAPAAAPAKKDTAAATKDAGTTVPTSGVVSGQSGSVVTSGEKASSPKKP